MKVSKVAAIWIDYHNTHSKKNTVRSYQSVIERFCQDFGDAEIGQVTPDDVHSFLNSFTNGNKPYTKRVRYSHLSAFFNFFRNNIDSTPGKSVRYPYDPKAILGQDSQGVSDEHRCF